MGSATTDRRMGLTGDKGIKAPVRAVTTTNIVLSGEQTIDGVSVKAVGLNGYPDRVLVCNQTNPIENGIWDVSTASWTRSVDADGTQDLVTGTGVLATEGASQANKYFVVSSPNPVAPGVTGLTFTAVISGLTSLLSSFGSSLIGFIQSGAGAVARTVQDELRETVKITQKGADPTGTVESSAAFTAAFTLSPKGPVQMPFGTYLSSTVSVPANGVLWGNNSLLKPSANNMTALFAVGGLGLGNPYYQEVRDLTIDATGKTGITGFSNDVVVANLTMENVKVENTDTISFNFGMAQFCRFTNLVAANGGGVGFYLAPAAGHGGANSNEFYGLAAVYKQVGLLIDGTAGGGTWGSIANNFYNLQVNGNSLCGIAAFYAAANFYGGSPEANCQSGPASATVQGKTVKQCSMYLNNSTVKAADFKVEEYNSTTFAILENSSVLTLDNVIGGSTSGATLVQADSTSGVVLSGLFQGLGLVQNVLSWPSGIIPGQAGRLIDQCVLYGVPALRIDSSFTPLLADASPTMSAFGSSPATLTYVEDAELGNCANLACTAVATGSVNVFNIPGLLANQNILISFLIKSSVNCSLYCIFYDGTNTRRIGTDGGLQLIAGQTVRVVMSAAVYNAGAGGSLQISPFDTSAPVLKISNMQVYQGPINNEKTFADMAKIVSTGAFNPGVIRDTAANLALKAQPVNAINKWPGKQVWDTTNNRMVFAAGRANTAVWKDGVNTTVYTPV